MTEQPARLRSPPTTALLLALVGLLGAGVFFGWRGRAERIERPQVLAALPAEPDLSGWPPEFVSRVRAAAAAARRFEQPRAALAELACLYHANGFFAEARRVELALCALEPGAARWPHYLADLAQNTGDTAGCERHLAEAIRLDATNAPARLKLADLLFKLNRLEEARVHYAARLALVPRDPYSRLGLARIVLWQQGPAAARGPLEELAREAEGFPTAHNLLAQVYDQAGDGVRAAAQRELGRMRFREADDPWIARLQAYSYDSYRLEVLGAIRMQAGQLQASLPFYEKAVALAPGDGSTYDALGDVYQQIGRLEDARATLQKGLAAAPGYEPLYSTLARLLRKQGRSDEARAILESGLVRLPGSADLHNSLGVALDDTGRPGEAARAYAKAVELHPGFAEAHLNLGLCLLRLGREAEAQASLQQALALRPGDVTALVVLAQKELEGGDLEKAGNYVRTLGKLRGDLPAARQLAALWHLRRGNAAAREDRLAEAGQEYRSGLAADPAMAELHANLGVLHVRAGRLEEAVAAFTRFVELAPADRRAHLYLAQALANAGRRAEARQAAERGRAMARQMGDGETVAQLERLLGQIAP